MSYFQTQNPWMEAAQYGQALGQTLGRHLLEIPKARAENEIALSQVPMQRALQQEQLNTSQANRAQQAQMLPLLLQEAQGNVRRQPLEEARIGATTASLQSETRNRDSVLDEHNRRNAALQEWQRMLRTQQNEPMNYVEQNPMMGASGLDPQEQIMRGVSMGVPSQEMQPLLQIMQDRMHQPLIQSQINENNAQANHWNNPLGRTAPDKIPQLLNTFNNTMMGIIKNNAGDLPEVGTEARRIFDDAYSNYQRLAEESKNYGYSGVKAPTQTNGTVRVINPQGQPVRIPSAQLQEALQSGYRLNQ